MRQARVKARWDLYQPEPDKVLTHARAGELEQPQRGEKVHE